MKSDKKLKEFLDEITISKNLNNSKYDKLISNRSTLRDKIKNYVKKNYPSCPVPVFYSQGSIALKTIIKPIKIEDKDGSKKEPYDLDDGVYFISETDKRKSAYTYRKYILEAVSDHTENAPVNKKTCIRVIYSDGHHIDLPAYWKEKDKSLSPELALNINDYIKSEPKAFKDWFNNKLKEYPNNQHIRKVIRLIKSWKNFRENKNQSLKLPSGFVFTILVCKYYKHEDLLDKCLRETIQNIRFNLNISFTCYRPTTPTDEDLLKRYNKDSTINELDKMLSNIDSAINSDNKNETDEHWKKVFGERYKGFNNDPNSTNQALGTATLTGSSTAIASKPWKLI